jgi:mannose-6-phosphate isomerase-like protein (cupin superfamily)
MRIQAVRPILPAFFIVILGLATLWTGGLEEAAQAQTSAAPQAAVATCPGETMAIQATGVYTQRPVEAFNINGQPAPGAIWSPGMRSFWHCHEGGQVLMVHEGVGRVQQRGARARTLQKGDTEYAGPGVEHWHGAALDHSAHYFQTVTGAGRTLWMEEVGYDDYIGNDIGITSRNEFLRTGVRNKPEQAKGPTRPPAR